MKLKKLGVAMLLIVISCTGCNKSQQQNTTAQEQTTTADDLTTTDKFSQMLTYFIDTDSYDYDDEVLDSFEASKNVINAHEEDGKGEFVSACFLLYEGEREEAATKLEEVLEQTDDVKIKSRCYYELCRSYANREDYDKADDALEQMQSLYDKESDKSFLIKLCTQFYYDMLEFPDGVNRAVTLMEDTEKLAEETDYDCREEVLLNLALCYYYAGETLKAMSARIEGLSIAEEHNNANMIMKLSADIGIDYLVAENYDKAIEYLQKSYDAIPVDDNSAKILQYRIYVNNQLFNCYIGKKDPDMALTYLNEAKDSVSKEHEGKQKEDDTTYCIASEAQYELLIGNTDRAIELMDTVKERYDSADYFLYSNFDIGYREVYGEIYNKMGDYEKALEYWNEVTELYKQQGVDTPDDSCLGGFYEAYKGLKDYETALKYRNMMYEGLSVSYKGRELEQANYLLEKFENDKKEEKITALQNRNRILWLLIGTSVIFAIVFSGFTIILIRKTREVKKLNLKFKELSEKDGLTGLYNRRAMDDYLNKNWEAFISQNQDNCIIMMDIDFFKKYNDYYGHQGGDYVLSKVGNVIKDNFRSGDMAVRYGGEEFAIILPGVSLGDAKSKAEQIRKEVELLAIPHEKSEIADVVSVSIGVAAAQSGDSSEQVLKHADDALYQAKKKRNAVYVYNE